MATGNKLSTAEKKNLLQYLLTYISQHKQELFTEKIAARTRYITVVLEDIYQPHNASAVLRTCDCFGIQDVHIIENQNKYEVNPDVALGSSKWLSLIKYNSKKENTLEAYQKLRAQGYRIIATTPHTEDVFLEDLQLDKKTALVFGTEMRGLSKEAIDNADGWVKIPMYGFTESFNISVSAAIILHNLTERLRKSKADWHLAEDDKNEILLSWARSVIKRPELIEQEFLKNV